MPNKNSFKLLSFIVLGSSLLGCQTAPKSTPEAAPKMAIPVEVEVTPKTDSAPVQQIDPEKALYQQAIQSTQNGDIDVAIQQFNQLIKTNPSANNAYTNLGLLYLHKTQNDKAKESFQIAIKQNINDAIAYNHLAIIQRQQGEFTHALYNYYNAINADQNYANAHLNLGILLDIYLQELPKALEQYEIYQQLNSPKNEQVDKWIIDIKRRIESKKGK